MKALNFLPFLFSLSLLVFTSCNLESEYTASSPKLYEKISTRTSLYLINTIEVTTNMQGNYYFVGSAGTVQDQVEEILIERNEILEEIDEFGFDFDTLGVQYFYALDHRPEGTLMFYVFLDSGSGALCAQQGGTQLANGHTCENQNCCDKCVVHSSLGCPCHRTMSSCYGQIPAAVPSCTKKNAPIT